MSAKKVVIVGGVAGGASCAARLRRLDERAEIVVFERGAHVSFANCGLPYHVGNVIPDEQKLLVATPELFHRRFRIDVRTEHEVVAIDRAASEVEVKDLRTGKTLRERYDALVLAPGAAPLKPPLPGLDRPGVFALRTIPDAARIRTWIEERKARRAVVVGAGFIGLEMVENLNARGLEVTVLEMADQVLPPLDPEMATFVTEWLEAKGVKLRLGDGLAGIDEDAGGGLVVRTSSGKSVAGDLVTLGLGVRPETGLAKGAGLALGGRGGIKVDDAMRTSDPKIWAVGDAVEVHDVVTDAWGLLALAGPANRQARIAAESIAGRPSTFRGVQGTAVCGVLGLVVAMTGASEKALVRAGKTDFERIWLHPGHHAGYYPGAKPLHLKLVFEKTTGRVLGAQAVGEEGVEKRIDVVAFAIQKGATVHDLAEAELCYAPQFGAAKDPVNVAGMIARNVLEGDVPLARWEDVGADGADGAVLLDVREPKEFAAGHVAGARNLPLPQIRDRLDELPRDREIWSYCGVGQRSYYATRLLAQSGFKARNLPGGWQTHRAFARAREAKAPPR